MSSGTSPAVAGRMFTVPQEVSFSIESDVLPERSAFLFLPMYPSRIISNHIYFSALIETEVKCGVCDAEVR